MAFLKLYCVIFAWIYLVSYYCGFFACSLLLIIFRTILSLFSSPPQKTTDSHFSYFVCTQHCHDEFSKEGNTIKIVFPAPMNEKWKWWNCFFKEPLCQLTNFHFLDSGEVEFWNLKAQSDWIYIYFCFYLYPAFKNKKNVGYLISYCSWNFLKITVMYYILFSKTLKSQSQNVKELDRIEVKEMKYCSVLILFRDIGTADAVLPFAQSTCI